MLGSQGDPLFSSVFRFSETPPGDSTCDLQFAMQVVDVVLTAHGKVYVVPGLTELRVGQTAGGRGSRTVTRCCCRSGEW